MNGNRKLTLIKNKNKGGGGNQDWSGSMDYVTKRGLLAESPVLQLQVTEEDKRLIQDSKSTVIQDSDNYYSDTLDNQNNDNHNK